MSINKFTRVSLQRRGNGWTRFYWLQRSVYFCSHNLTTRAFPRNLSHLQIMSTWRRRVIPRFNSSLQHRRTTRWYIEQSKWGPTGKYPKLYNWRTMAAMYTSVKDKSIISNYTWKMFRSSSTFWDPHPYKLPQVGIFDGISIITHTTVTIHI